MYISSLQGTWLGIKRTRIIIIIRILETGGGEGIIDLIEKRRRVEIKKGIKIKVGICEFNWRWWRGWWDIINILIEYNWYRIYGVELGGDGQNVLRIFEIKYYENLKWYLEKSSEDKYGIIISWWNKINK